MSGTGKEFLDRAYGLDSAESTHAFYEDWAASYDEEVLANGYATPGRCADALAAAVADPNAPLLDLGCGTGLSGAAFKQAGFLAIDGTDFSEEMLAMARRRQGVYRELILGDLNHPIPASPGQYANMAAVGVFSPGHAPAAMIGDVMDRLPSGGCFVFSLNDHTLEDESYNDRIEALVSSGIVDIAFRQYGDHLPKRNIKADVCVLRRRALARE